MKHEKTKCIDTTFNVNDDARGKDPDKYSQTLKDYHRKLWSKELPCGIGRIDLAPEFNSLPGAQVLEWSLFHSQRRHHPGLIIKNIPPEDLPAWPRYTIGSSTVFPGNKVNAATSSSTVPDLGMHPPQLRRPQEAESP